MDVYVLLAGLITGALYATTGVGISIIYRSSRLLNFALAGTSTLAVYVATQLVSPGAPVALVVVIAVVAGAVAGGLSEVLLGPLRHYPPMTAGIATLGVLLIAQGIVAWIWGYDPRRVQWLSDSNLHLSVPGGRIGALQIVALAIAIVAISLVYVFVEKTKYGLALRMSSSGPITAQLLGVNIWRTRRMSWVIGGAMGGVAALMVTALTYLDPAAFTGFMIVAFVATVLGGFTNFIGVALGGVVVGVLVNILRVELSTELTQTYTLALIAIVLALKPNGLLGRPEREVPEPDLPSVGKGSIVSRLVNRRAGSGAANAIVANADGSRVGQPLAVRAGLGIVIVVLLVALPYLVTPDLLPILPAIMTTFIAVLGLNMLVGYGGQFSVGHAAFMAVGAYSAALATQHLDLPPLLGVVVGTLAGLVIGFLVGLPVTRLAGVFLTIVTIILPLVTTELALLFDGVTGGATGLLYTFPDWLFASENQYWFALGIAAICAAGVYALRNSPTGHRWIAVRDALPGAQSIGINVMTTRLSAFSIGCGLAGLAGSLDAGFVGSVGPSSYTTWLSIYLLAAVIIGGSGSIVGALLGSFFVVLIPHFVSGTSIPPDLLFGIALLSVMIITPRGLVFVAERLLDAVLRAVRRRTRTESGWDPEEEMEVLHAKDDVPVEPALSGARIPADRGPVNERVLDITGLRAGYDQISVLRGVDLTVRAGEFTALIGANGAGKTTLLRAISGLIRIDAGEVNFLGSSVAGSRADQISRLGIAHVPEGRGVFPDLTVKENLLAGRFSAADREPDIDRALDVFPQLERLTGRVAGTLSGGEQQMVAVARAIATNPKLLMLDEPSLGLSPKASKDLFATLEQLKGSDLTVLLIEQNARAAMALADTCCLFADGVIVREGPASSFEDDHMVSTYLGVTV